MENVITTGLTSMVGSLVVAEGTLPMYAATSPNAHSGECDGLGGRGMRSYPKRGSSNERSQRVHCELWEISEELPVTLLSNMYLI